MKSFRSSPRGKQRGVFINPWCFKQRVNVSVKSLMFVSCDTVVTLSATITGNAIKRTYEWVQKTGAAVNWLEDRFQAEVTFEQPTVRDDKIFIFYMDRGLSTEVRKEILVTTVPVERITPSVRPTTSVVSNLLGDEMVAAYYYMPALSPYNEATVNNANKNLAWTNPSVSYFSNSYVTETKADGTVSDIQIGLSNYLKNTLLDAAYKITSVVSYFGVTRQSSISDIFYDASGSDQTADASDELIFLAPAVTTLTSITEVMTRELYTLSSVPDEYVGMFLLPSVSAASITEVMTRELYTLSSVPDEYVGMFLLPSASTTSILEIKELTLTTIG